MEIIKAPDPRLRKKARPVETVDDSVRRIMDDMLETMYNSDGVGLAAIQVGIEKRIVTLDVAQREGARKPMFFANPEIIWKSEETSVYNEGCLSFPGQFAEVSRPKEIKIKFLDYEGREQEISAGKLLAVCLQHEIDHLDGKVFVDYISPVKRDVILRKLKKMKRSDGEEATE